MSEIEFAYYCAVGAALVCSIANWRAGLYLCLVIDLLRDPVRKLSASQSVIITVAGASLWVGVFLGAWLSLGPRLFAPLRQFRALKSSVTLLFLALLPAAFVSYVSIQGGWKVAGIGLASYGLPVLGILVGFHWIRRDDDLWKLLAFYCAVNALFLGSSVCEFLKIDVPALGGINVKWVRYRLNYTVDLISGFYRSPDVMGLHAACVCMFGTLLALRRNVQSRIPWIAVVIWAGASLLLSGRRKMIGMLIVFGVVYIGLRLRSRGLRQAVPIMGMLLSAMLAVLLLSTQFDAAKEYIDYAQTTITESGERLSDNIIDGIINSVDQAGIMGWGLGAVTQGRRYAMEFMVTETQRIEGWQEDGISRIFAEMGVFGAVLILVSLIQGLGAARLAFHMVPALSPVRDMQIGLAGVVAAIGVSFVFSHQAFSGDPCSMLLVTVLLGVYFSGPLQVMRQMIIDEHLEEEPAGESDETEILPVAPRHKGGSPS